MPATFSEFELVNAHLHCSHNLEDVQKSSSCGCFSCLKTFSPTEVTEWLHDETVICPYCGIDSILGSQAGYPLVQDFLEAMNRRWFGTTKRPQLQKNGRLAILEVVAVTGIGLILEALFPKNLWVLALVIAGVTVVTLGATYQASKIKRRPRPGTEGQAPIKSVSRWK